MALTIGSVITFGSGISLNPPPPVPTTILQSFSSGQQMPQSKDGPQMLRAVRRIAI